MAPDIENYRKLKNQLKIYVHEAKLSYLKELLQKARKDPRLSAQLWSGVNNILGRCRSHCDGVTCPLSPDRVNNFFQNVAISCDHQPACNFIPPSPSINAVRSFEFSFMIHLLFCYYLKDWTPGRQWALMVSLPDFSEKLQLR